MECDIRQDISVKFFGTKEAPERLILTFGNDWANFPSVANAKRRIVHGGKLVWNAKLHRKLEGYTKLVLAACRRELGFIPSFNEPLVAIIGLSGVNKRKDIDNSFKGVIDHAIERPGIIINDKLILILPVPLWWGFRDEGFSIIDLQRWRDIKDAYCQFLRGRYFFSNLSF